MSLFSGLFGGARESRAFEESVWSTGADVSTLGGVTTLAGTMVNEEQAMRIESVFGSVRLYAQIIASLPIAVAVRFNGIRRPLYPRPVWVDKPNLEDRQFDFMHKVVESMLLYGNSYIFVTRDRLGAVVELIVIHPDLITPVRHPVTNRKVYVFNGDYSTYYDDTWEVVHIRHMASPGSLVGRSPIQANRELLGLAQATAEFGSKFFSNGAHLSGVIQTKDNITPEQAEALRVGWANKHSGLQNAHKPGVLSAAEWKPMTVSPEDAQFLETRKFTTSTIAGAIFGIPPHLLGQSGDASNWGTGIESLFNGWLSTAMAPILENIEGALSSLVEQEGFIKFKTDALMRTDAKTRVDVQRAQIEMGVTSIDEVRAQNDQPPLPNGVGAVHYRPQNWQPVEPTANTPPTDPEDAA